jgi:hypothetical protein
MPKRMEVEHREHVGHAQWSGGVTGPSPDEHFDDRLTNLIRGLFENVFLVWREEHPISSVAVERVWQMLIMRFARRYPMAERLAFDLLSELELRRC